MATDIQYEYGNSNNPVLVIGDDPSNGAEGYEDQDNVLISRLPQAVSVPRDQVSKTEGTAEPEESSA